mmetsp:Transcript_23061/g.39906  ORF Transcript_23061/g.39906 Transcript_23061/m.39906 type:complete len:379 (-) Transcript_23061:550-1686(-)|eukprot:CAMPEP_0184970568 /NCGR_PEP_ID=MMETSP1098-20130426/3001_1 /TAXON_ID=89044 /ORGANISM="Spumella elongata, Strain CCAP 955/1" /LENGTH=378 /DNA_ID=CAMNT_0027492519 /DNA_START=40 /DNA_END=1176 /DNA_ORIENTATION=+
MRGGLTSDSEENTSSYQLRPKRKREVSSVPEDQPHSVKASTPCKKMIDVSSFDSKGDLSSDGGAIHTLRCDGQFKTRSELVKSFDPVIASFRSADYETFLKLAEGLFANDVLLSYKLFPDPVADIVSDEFFDIDSYVVPDPPVQEEGNFQQLTGVSAVALLWMYLREVHLDGDMEVIDRRICYRQVLPDYLQLFNIDRSEAQPTMPTRSRRASKLPTASTSSTLTTQAPVSIVEMVVKLSGSCVTQRPLDALFADLLQAQTTSSNGSEVNNETEDLTADALKTRITDFLVQHSEPAVSSNQSEGFQDTVSSQSLRHVVSVTTTSTDSTENEELRALLGAPRSIHRKYLADIKLAYNEHDVITLFEFNVRAAEEFPEDL